MSVVLPLEERVAILEAELHELKQLLSQKAEVPWWEQIAGTWAHDSEFDEAMRLGREYREAQRPVEDDAQGDDVSA